MTAFDREKRNDHVLAVAIATGASYASAAEAAGISERTVRRRVRDEDFRTEVERLRGELVDRAAGQLLDRLSVAIDTLDGLLTSDSEGTRLKAVLAVVDRALSFYETLNVERCLAAVEEAADGNDVAHRSA